MSTIKMRIPGSLVIRLRYRLARKIMPKSYDQLGGRIWYRTDTDKIRVRSNGEPENMR